MNNNSSPTAILIDTMSIQQYVFSSNKLSINLGASYNVAKYFSNICNIILNNNFDKSEYEGTQLIDSKLEYNNIKYVKYFIGYIGGGNGLLFFENTAQATIFLQQFFLKLLADFPGLIVNYGIKEDFDINNYSTEITELFNSLNKNKNTSIPITQAKKINIATLSDFDNQAAAQQDKYKNIDKLFSKSSFSKQNNNDSSIKNFEKLFMPKDLKDAGYKFPSEFENISLQDEKGHLAIVHIDGNGFGKLFQSCTSLDEARSLSKAVEDLALNTIKQLINNHIICKDDKRNINEAKFEETFGFPMKEKNLPFRPIVISGDDITFVCDGKLGIYLAEKCIELFTNVQNLKEIKKIRKDANITACAGIAIVKRKFPFIKSYILAEELCKAAKMKAKESDTIYSALEYHIANSGFAGSWESIKHSYYQRGNSNLHSGPYFIIDPSYNTNNNNSFSSLKNAAKYYLNNWSKNKLATLKRMSWETSKKQEIFLLESKLQNENHVLYNQSSDLKNEYDSIELIDFYPNTLL